MRVVVQDASILIDLAAGELLEAWFALGIETLTTSLVWREITQRSQRARWSRYAEQKQIKVMPLKMEAMSAVVTLRADLPPAVTLQDASALYLALESEGKAALLTGDSQLRRAAEQRGVKTRGMLWVLDELVERGILSSSEAARKLKVLMSQGSRLPKADSDTRLKKWQES